jgi:hypothetical protein
MIRLDPNPAACDVDPPAVVTSKANPSPEANRSPDAPDAVCRADAADGESADREPAASAPDLSIARDQICRRLAGARSRLLLTRRADLAQQRDPIFAGSKPVDPGGAADAKSDAPASPRTTRRFSVVVAPRLPDGDLVLAVRYSYAALQWGLELPRLDDQEEDEGWFSPAQRSLAECGLTCNSRMLILGALRLDASGSAGSLLVVFADNCRMAPASARNETAILAGVVVARPSVVAAMARKGDIECARTLAALQLLRSRVEEI